jgi:hypothetical protein
MLGSSMQREMISSRVIDDTTNKRDFCSKKQNMSETKDVLLIVSTEASEPKKEDHTSLFHDKRRSSRQSNVNS